MFWPPSNYNDSTPLPAAWLSLMTRERKINEFNIRKRSGPLHFYESEKEELKAKEIRSITATRYSNFGQVADQEESPKAAPSRFASIGFNTAAAAAAASEKHRSRAAHSMDGMSRGAMNSSDSINEEYEVMIDFACVYN